MASKIARSAIGATARPSIRPTPISSASTSLLLRPLLTITSSSSTTRSASTSTPDISPEKRAQSLLDSLPGSTLISKTAILSSAAGLSAWAISNEIYVFTEETITAFSLLTVFYAIARYGSPMYTSWAEGQCAKITNILNAAREEHTNAVRDRIENVKGMEGVVETTKQMFEMSKETVELEAKAFEMGQRVRLGEEARGVLDSWVRYEGQVKARQQREVAEGVMGRVGRELENPKVLERILQQSVQDVERIVSSKAQ